jgi:hypothetical protein
MLPATNGLGFAVVAVTFPITVFLPPLGPLVLLSVMAGAAARAGATPAPSSSVVAATDAKAALPERRSMTSLLRVVPAGSDEAWPPEAA